MSKHNKDYTRFSKEPVEPEVADVPVEEPNEKTPIEFGYVDNCVKLNVRTEPHANAEIACVIDVSDELMIYPVHSTDEFYKVCTAAGVEGYCMKKFITIM